MRQFTKEEAIAIYDSNIWKEWTDEEIVKVQLFQDKLCMDFSRFHEAIEKILDRSVWTHEFADQNRLIEEYLGLRQKPTMEDIINLIPSDKLLIIKV